MFLYLTEKYFSNELIFFKFEKNNFPTKRKRISSKILFQPSLSHRHPISTSWAPRPSIVHPDFNPLSHSRLWPSTPNPQPSTTDPEPWSRSPTTNPDPQFWMIPTLEFDPHSWSWPWTLIPYLGAWISTRNREAQPRFPDHGPRTSDPYFPTPDSNPGTLNQMKKVQIYPLKS